MLQTYSHGDAHDVLINPKAMLCTQHPFIHFVYLVSETEERHYISTSFQRSRRLREVCSQFFLRYGTIRAEIVQGAAA